MERKELRKYIRERFKSMGYQSYKSYQYKVLDDDYLIGFDLYPSTYTKGYYFDCGVIYLPDEYKIPLRGLYDYGNRFIFPNPPEIPFDIEKCKESRSFTTTFRYEEHTLEQLDEWFHQNYKYYMIPLLDKEYALERFRKDLRLMNAFKPKTIDKLCKRAGMNTQEVLRILGKTDC